MTKLYGIDTDKLRDADLVVIRSDTGDGGWSLHWLHDENEDGMPGAILVSGPSSFNDDTGDWNRPGVEDYADAIDALLTSR
jgi:hypothetical protein